MIVLDPEDRKSIACYALRVMAVVIVAIICGSNAATIVGGLI